MVIAHAWFDQFIQQLMQYHLIRPKTKPDEPTHQSKKCVHATTAPHQFSWNVYMYIIASENPLGKSIADRAISSRGVISKSSVNRRLISAQPLECHRDNTLGKHFSPAGVPLFSHYHISYLSSLVVLVYPDGGGAWRSSDSRVVVCFSWFVSSCETESQHQTKRQFHSRLCEPGAKFNTYWRGPLSSSYFLGWIIMARCCWRNNKMSKIDIILVMI